MREQVSTTNLMMMTIHLCSLVFFQVAPEGEPVFSGFSFSFSAPLFFLESHSEYQLSLSLWFVSLFLRIVSLLLVEKHFLHQLMLVWSSQPVLMQFAVLRCIVIETHPAGLNSVVVFQLLLLWLFFSLSLMVVVKEVACPSCSQLFHSSYYHSLMVGVFEPYTGPRY